MLFLINGWPNSNIYYEPVFRVMNDNFIDVEDYNGNTATVIIPAGVTSHQHTISIIDDNAVECDETFSVTISSVTTCGVTIGSVNNAKVTITDDDGM